MQPYIYGFCIFVSETVKGRQTMDSNGEIISPSPRYKHVYMSDKTKSKRKNFDHTDPFAIRDFVLGFDSPKYGSVTKDIEDLFSRKKQMFMPTFRKFPLLGVDSLDLKPGKDISIAIENTKHDTNAQAQQLVVIIDSDDDDEPTSQIPSKSFQDAVLKIPSKPHEDIELKIPSKAYNDTLLNEPTEQPMEQLLVSFSCHMIQSKSSLQFVK